MLVGPPAGRGRGLVEGSRRCIAGGGAEGRREALLEKAKRRQEAVEQSHTPQRNAVDGRDEEVLESGAAQGSWEASVTSNHCWMNWRGVFHNLSSLLRDVCSFRIKGRGKSDIQVLSLLYIIRCITSQIPFGKCTIRRPRARLPSL